MDRFQPDVVSEVLARIEGLERRASQMLAELAAVRGQLSDLRDALTSLSSAAEDSRTSSEDKCSRGRDLAWDEDQDGPRPPSLSHEQIEALQREVRQAVAAARQSEPATPLEAPTQHLEADDDDEARREAVRRVVAEARAELGLPHPLGLVTSGASNAPAGAASEQGTPGLSEAALQAAERWQASARTGPAPTSIIFEDPVGRVELVRVYAVLSELNCGDEAALLNYTLHNVSIGLHSQVQAPSPEVLADAVRQVFQRDCEVTSDGIHYSVKLIDTRPASARW